MIVFDLDGTLRDITGCEHTMPDDKSRAEHWLEWQRWVNTNGKPNEPIMRLFVDMLTLNHSLKIVTNSQFGTFRWLKGYLPVWLRDDIKDGVDIIERDPDDHRHPHDFKRQWIDDNIEIIDLWIDDDPVILDYVESLGIPTVRVKIERCHSV